MKDYSGNNVARIAKSIEKLNLNFTTHEKSVLLGAICEMNFIHRQHISQKVIDGLIREHLGDWDLI